MNHQTDKQLLNYIIFNYLHNKKETLFQNISNYLNHIIYL